GSNAFPTTPGAFQPVGGDGYHSSSAFVTKVNPSGSALVYSTYLGGIGFGSGIAVDADGNAYVTGGGSVPTSAGAFQPTGGAAFVSTLDPSGTGLVYSTYLGGRADDRGNRIAVDAAGNAYVSGVTQSTNFPTTGDGLRSTLAGFADAFVTKLNPTGSALAYSTYLGGSDNSSCCGDGDSGEGIAVDASGNAYVTGSANSTDFPTTPGAFQASYGGGGTDTFITKIATN